MEEDLQFLFVDEAPVEPDYSELHIGNESDDPTVSDGEEEAPGEPLQRENSRKLRDRLEVPTIAGKVKATLLFMKQQGLDVVIFLDALCWGDEGCHSDSQIVFARTGLMVSEELPQILQRCYNPPRRSGKAHGARPAGARRVLLDFATSCISDMIDREMKLSASLFLSPPEELSEEHLTDLDFGVFMERVQASAPILWQILRRAAYTPEQEKRNKYKNPNMVWCYFIRPEKGNSN
jgi:hypothetical protein